jgi:Protein of unknown function (DUF1822)
MSFNTASPTLLPLDQLYLEIPQDLPSQQAFSTLGAEWRSHLNQAAIAAFSPWLQEEHPAQHPAQHSTQHPAQHPAQHSIQWTTRNPAALSAIWEFVNGTAISCAGLRIVLIPSESLDIEELRVPQEWVDIPTWAADYYIAVQVNSDEGWICIQGYTTHHRLKTQGLYDASDRTYSLAEDDLIRNINLLWLSRELCPDEPSQMEVAPLPFLPVEQANSLIQRLSNPEFAFARLEVPFQRWGSLLEHDGWRQRLYQQRQGITEQQSVGEWLRSGISAVAQQMGWGQMQFQPATAMRSLPIAALVRPLTIGDRGYELRVFSVSELRDLQAPAWRFELRPAAAPPETEPLETIPSGFTLRLLTEDLQPFENNEDTATEPMASLYVDVLVEPGEGLVWEIEPAPNGCDREILRF